MKLDSLPIEFSTIKDIKKANIVKSFGVTDISNEQFNLKGCQCRIVEIRNRKFLELKNREIKLGLEIDLKDDGSFNTIINNYYYKLNIIKIFKRYIFNMEILKNIFEGNLFNITGKEINGTLSFENRIEVMKFDLLLQELQTLEKKHKEKVLCDGNRFYAIALSNLLEENSTINSWVNLKMKNSSDLIVGDIVNIERVHTLEGNEFDIKEKIELLNPVDEKELSEQGFIAYRKTCRITLEKVSKKK